MLAIVVQELNSVSGFNLYSAVYKGQVALEFNFRFVQDKFDLKSETDKKFVRKATVALENRICEQILLSTFCFSAHSWTNSLSSSSSHLSYAFLFSGDEGVQCEEVGVYISIELSSLNWRDSGNASVFATGGDGLGFPQWLTI